MGQNHQLDSTLSDWSQLFRGGAIFLTHLKPAEKCYPEPHSHQYLRSHSRWNGALGITTALPRANFGSVKGIMHHRDPFFGEWFLEILGVSQCFHVFSCFFCSIGWRKTGKNTQLKHVPATRLWWSLGSLLIDLHTSSNFGAQRTIDVGQELCVCEHGTQLLHHSIHRGGTHLCGGWFS